MAGYSMDAISRRNSNIQSGQMGSGGGMGTLMSLYNGYNSLGDISDSVSDGRPSDGYQAKPGSIPSDAPAFNPNGQDSSTYVDNNKNGVKSGQQQSGSKSGLLSLLELF